MTDGAIVTLDGLESGTYIITTLSGTRHFVNLDHRTSVRIGAEGHEWGDKMVTGHLGDNVGGARPKALVSMEDITPDGTAFHFLLIQNATVGQSMRLDNMDEWRITSTIQSIEKIEDE